MSDKNATPTTGGTVTILRADSRRLPLTDASVDLIVTSPPYFALRSYTDGGEHYDGQIGAEATPQDYIAALIECTREWMRVLKPSGSIWVNLGDKYAGAPSGPQGATSEFNERTGQRFAQRRRVSHEIKNKSLMMLPERYRIACVDDLGLIARAVVIWSKPNGLPESVTDRVRRSHEDWVHLTKAPRYFSAVDEIREEHIGGWGGRGDYKTKAKATPGQSPHSSLDRTMGNPLGKLPGSVWEIATQPLKVPAELGIDHFAAFPTEWPRRIILGWSPSGICVECGEGRRPVVHTPSAPGAVKRANAVATDAPRGLGATSALVLSGTPLQKWRAENPALLTGYACACPDQSAPTRPAVVLDPFGGTGTTALVASVLGRHGISVDRSADYCRLAEWRTSDPGQRARVLKVKIPRQREGRCDVPSDALVLDASHTDTETDGETPVPDKDMMLRIREHEEQSPWRALDMLIGAEARGVEPSDVAAPLRDALAFLVEDWRKLADMYAEAKLKGAQSTYVVPLRNAAAQLDKVVKALHQPRRALLGEIQPTSGAPAGAVEPGEPAAPPVAECPAVAARQGHAAHRWIGAPTSEGAPHHGARWCSGHIAATHTVESLDKLIADSLPGQHPADSPSGTVLVSEQCPEITVVEPVPVFVPTSLIEHVEPIGDVAAYLSGASDELPGGVELQPGSVHDMTEQVAAVGDAVETLLSDPRTPPMPTARDNLENSTVTIPPMPVLGQPGDAGRGYDHSYVPTGSAVATFAELLTPVPAAFLPAHLSHSQAETVGDCAAKYRLQRLAERVVPLPSIIEIPQWALIGGSAFHAVIENIERAVLVANGADTVANMLADFLDRAAALWTEAFTAEILRIEQSSPVPRARWRASKSGAEGETWWNANGPEMIRRYLAARPAEATALLQQAPATVPDLPAIEVERTVQVATAYGAIAYRATLDRVTVRTDADGLPVFVIRDYKTGASMPGDKSQLGEYAQVLRLLGLPAPIKILGSFFNARKGVWTEPVDLEAAGYDLDWFTYKVTAAHAQKLALTTGPTPARPSTFCGGCSVRYACPVARAGGK